MSHHTEQAWVMTRGEQRLVGVASLPTRHTMSSVGVVVVVGGPQYRAGSHRQFVLLARALADAGHPVLRFDCCGMGDSTGELRNFEHIGNDIATACDAMAQRLPQVRRLVLWGLCDGASAALMYCQQTQDPRIAGLCLLNPWTRSETTLARTRVKHYYLQRLAQREFWAKLLKGGVALRAVAELLGNLKKSRSKGGHRASAADSLLYQQRMALGWSRFKGEILLVLSGNDYTAKEFLEHAQGDAQWQHCLAQASVQRIDLATADHTFSAHSDREQVEQDTLSWLQRIAQASPAGHA
jgi:exosortase A-associated hydrolase 1